MQKNNKESTKSYFYVIYSHSVGTKIRRLFLSLKAASRKRD